MHYIEHIKVTAICITITAHCLTAHYVTTRVTAFVPLGLTTVWFTKAVFGEVFAEIFGGITACV